MSADGSRYNPVYGWVNATPHIGEPRVSVYGADPESHPEPAWKVVREIALPGAGAGDADR